MLLLLLLIPTVWCDFRAEIDVKIYKPSSSFLHQRALTVTEFVDAVEIQIEGQQLEELASGTFANLPNLRIIKIKYCPNLTSIESGAFAHVPLLKIVNLNFNALKTVGNGVFSGLSAVIQLTLVGNGIETMAECAFCNMTQLQVLDLSNNRISAFYRTAFLNTHSLRRLDFSHNLLANLPEDMLSGGFDGAYKSSLDFSFNQLRYVGSNAFRGVFELDELKLDNNALEQLGPGVFSGFRRLDRLDLQDNGLTFLGKDILASLTDCEEILLGSNRWKSVFLEKYMIWCKVHNKTNSIPVSNHYPVE